MAKFLLIGALIFMLATGALAFLAKGNVDKLQSSLKETKGTLTSTEGKLRTANNNLEKAAEEVKVANAKAEEKEKEAATAKAQMDDLNSKMTAAKAEVEAKAAEVTKLTADMDALRAKMGPNSKPDDDLGAKLAELNGALSKAQADLSEAKVVQDGLNRRLADTEGKLSAAELKEKQRQTSFVRPGLQGRILAVNAGWNFVVLSIGDKQGAVVNAPMLVIRDNEPIGKVRITSVETSTSIADVVPGSIRKGVSVQPGDNVVFEGRSAATQPPAPAAPAAAMPRP